MLEWSDDSHCRVGNADLVLAEFVDRSVETLWIEKSRSTVEAFAEILSEFRSANVVELGIKRGGSTVLLNELTSPRRLVAVDIEAQAPPSLTDYLRIADPDGVVRPYFGVDQHDRVQVAEIVDAEFGDEPLDLVVDDASHGWMETRTSFEVLFPRLRPGGLFLVEDWNWEHLVASAIERDSHLDPELDPDGLAVAVQRGLREVDRLNQPGDVSHDGRRRPLTDLIHELVVARSRSAEVVASVGVDNLWVQVRRGPAALDAGSFGLADHARDFFDQLRDDS